MEYLHETSVGDLLKVIDAFGQVLKTTPEGGKSKLNTIIKNTTRGNNYKGSITSQANKLCMTFPVLCSNTVTPATASMISKAIERKCTLMLHQIFAADILVAGANSGGIQQKINGVYTGIDFDTMSVDDVINITDKLEGNKAFFESHEVMNEMTDLAKKIMNSGHYEESINEYSVAKYMVDEKGSIKEDATMIFNEARKAPVIPNPDPADVINDLFDSLDSKINKNINSIDTDSDPESIATLTKIIRDRLGYEMDRETLDMLRQFDSKKRKAEIEKIKSDMKYAKKRYNLEKSREEREEAKEKRNIAKDRRDTQEFKARMRAAGSADLAARNDMFKKALMDTDVKKVNELVPSLLIVNYAINVENGEPITSSAIVGVKTRLISLDSFQILEKLASKNKDKSGFVKFIKATTGEIKFFKDFVLAIDKAKVDALNKSKRGSANPIWKVLERRAAINNLRKALNQKNDASPITTLVITQEEVDYLRKTAGMELDNVNTANYILNAYNLMGLCIVDEATEVAKFLFDGEFNQFDTYAFNTLERESAGDNGMYKKVINLMAKRM